MDVDPTPGASGLLPTEDVDMEEGTVEKGEEGEDEVPPPPPMPDLNTPEDAIAYWSSSMEKGNLSCHHFREWWRRIVPRLLSPSPNMDYKAPQAHIDDEEVTRQLLRPLETFMFSGDPAEEMEKLSKLEDPPAQCCKLFKMGEPTYSCRDCGHDPTCVLCVDCFKNSEHRHHRYKISTSCGGGYCDCGDVEAFSNYAHCSVHILGTKGGKDGQQSHPLKKVPASIQERAKHVFTAILKYAYEMLTLDSMINLPADLTYKEGSEMSLLTDSPLDLLDAEQNYCAVVFNDEVHTFDEVIQTLPRAVDCDRVSAIDFATLIDREGRSIIKCSGFQVCNEAKRTIERITSRRGFPPLKVQVAHGHIVAHQNFALRLLAWLQGFLDLSAGFRALFSLTALQTDTRERCSIVELFCRHDTVLWKSPRTMMHHLLISGMLMENESKRQFACEFAKGYGCMMKDFMQDDHDHSFSITSLSVQLFTVPTLAHYLIGEEDVLAVLLMTFMSECERKRNERGKLEFPRNGGHQAQYKRANFILYDLKYLLTSPPSSWEDSLRRGFLHGVALLFDVLSWKQGMDPQIRQTSHHVEYELEWESAFNLHIKIAPVTSLTCAWAGSDRVVFIKTVRMLFKKLWEDGRTSGDMSNTSRLVACGKEVTCIDYQVSSKPVSVHLPLTRALAGLSLYMGRFDINLRSNEFNIRERPTMLEMMEPALRMTVLAAQVHAGMWRRNGYSLVDQVRIYRDPRCRKEMYDQDITILQLAAANMEPDEYLIALLDKFGLTAWSGASFDSASNQDDAVRQIATIVEEFLATLIILLSERFTPGVGQVTTEEALQKEIIQLLCIEPMSHSTLNKALAEDVNRETGMEKVVESVASFKKPSSGLGKGVYELKEEFYDQYNVFFYHYTKEEQSKSEVSQRSRRKTAGLPQCSPPPLPPLFTKEFVGITRLMDCDVFLYLLSVVLKRADNLKTRCFSEGQVHRALHLIGLCLKEEERCSRAQEATAHSVKFTERAKRFDLIRLLECLVGNQRIESHKELLSWVLANWKCATATPTTPSSSSGMAAPPPGGAGGTSDRVAEKKAAAAARRAKIMAQMQSAQKSFMKENATLFKETPSELERGKQRTESVSSTEVAEVQTGASSSSSRPPSALGPDRSAPTLADATFTCILCQEEESLCADGPSLVMAAFIQRSTVLSKRRVCKKDLFDEKGWLVLEECSPLPPPQYLTCPLLLADMPSAPHTSSCGHIMHASCWQKFYEDILAHERQRNRGMRHPHSFDVERQEFLCPMCRRLSNAVMPLIPQFHVLQARTRDEAQLGFSEWVQAMQIALSYKRALTSESDQSSPVAETGSDQEMTPAPEVRTSPGSLSVRKHYYTCPLDQVTQELQERTDMNSADTFAQLFTGHEGAELKFSDSVFEMMGNFSKAVFRAGLSTAPEHNDERIPFLVWQTCSFTVHSVVCSILDQGGSVFGQMSSRHKDCLSGLVRFCGVVGSNLGDSKIIRSHALKLLSSVMEVDTANLSVLEFDAFGMLVALTFCLPSLFNENRPAQLPSCTSQDSNILRLVYSAHLVQILLTTDQFTTASDGSEEEDKKDLKKEEECRPVLNLLKVVRNAVGFASDSDGSEGLRADCVWRDLRHASMPFLRCCAVFYHHLSGVPIPDCGNVRLSLEDGKEFEMLADYLNLPTSPDELLSSAQVFKLALGWANHPAVHISLSTASPVPPVVHSASTAPLVSLPQDYSELINAVSGFVCPRSSSSGSGASSALGVEESRVPALCLVCGQLLCSQSYCCQEVLGGEQVGACTAHADRCGAGNGIFLRVRECKVILVSGRKKGCSIPPPYLDRYGETDVGLRRGNPLHLCPQRLSKIQKLWLNHGIPEEIAHTVESNVIFMAHRWQDL